MLKLRNMCRAHTPLHALWCVGRSTFGSFWPRGHLKIYLFGSPSDALYQGIGSRYRVSSHKDWAHAPDMPRGAWAKSIGSQSTHVPSFSQVPQIYAAMLSGPYIHPSYFSYFRSVIIYRLVTKIKWEVLVYLSRADYYIPQKKDKRPEAAKFFTCSRTDIRVLNRQYPL